MSLLKKNFAEVFQKMFWELSGQRCRHPGYRAVYVFFVFCMVLSHDVGASDLMREPAYSSTYLELSYIIALRPHALLLETTMIHKHGGHLYLTVLETHGACYKANLMLPGKMETDTQLDGDSFKTRYMDVAANLSTRSETPCRARR
ncbi:hypothetical protein OUZ56_027944 [Daphnia magna]|uniref:Uncharacterized protein n=1 Tax=Daphnia magna TaxID=35525 RepID=A0ABR0B2K9_9CRUS|nr:hypothetical protein OUZ56_027944 [Daphnia magna]